jgi:hypothetical protein
MINIKDANGKWVVVTTEDFMEAISKHCITLFGISIEKILEWRKEYMEKGGKL